MDEAFRNNMGNMGRDASSKGLEIFGNLDAVIASLEQRPGHEELVTMLMDLSRNKTRKALLEAELNMRSSAKYDNFLDLPNAAAIERVTGLLAEFLSPDKEQSAIASKAKEIAKVLDF